MRVKYTHFVCLLTLFLTLAHYFLTAFYAWTDYFMKSDICFSRYNMAYLFMCYYVYCVSTVKMFLYVKHV